MKFETFKIWCSLNFKRFENQTLFNLGASIKFSLEIQIFNIPKFEGLLI